ncbi:hypothetical protein FRB95_008690 [Tulasnella sp. JGI-2019a]|nr:hypothetical protein FRB95_008690 [Tulasnella sp. JGI-2019a]
MLLYVPGFIWALSSLVLAQLTVDTPVNVVQCQPTTLNWSGGTGPYNVFVLPGRQPNAVSIESTISAVPATSLTWGVEIAAGTLVMIGVMDATGAEAYSGARYTDYSRD